MRKILWIEDQADIIGNIFLVVKKNGFSIDVVTCGKDYYHLSSELSDFTLIVLDYTLPWGDGTVNVNKNICIDIIKDIREDKKILTPIIVLTNWDSEFKNMTNLQKLENVHLHSKLIFPDELYVIVKDVLGIKD